MSMQEALRKAARENPRSDLADKVYDSVRHQRDNRHGTDLVYLTKDFINIGERWRVARVLQSGRVLQSLGEIRGQWDVGLASRKRVVRNDFEGELLFKAMIEKGIDPAGLDRFGYLGKFDARLQWPPQSMGLSLGSRLLVYAMSDLSRYTPEKNNEFASFIEKGRNKVLSMYDLPVVIPLVNSWLNRSS